MDEEGSVGCSVIHAHGSERTMMMMLLVGWWVVGSVYLSSAIQPPIERSSHDSIPSPFFHNLPTDWTWWSLMMVTTATI